ncbi:MAG: hypothetical protein B6D47_04830 [Rhodocyclaceae bacterium UTPRO2]|nr:MAG: hypothetical protein B6D47_04830 [Rhodocyclaceae bacterium UTPRO2]
MMNRAVLYLRSSKDRSDVSIDAQRRELQSLAQTRGIIIAGEYSDAVESGKDDDRPGFQSMLRDLRAEGRTWNHVLVLDTARIARRRVLAIIFEEHECKRRGVRIIYKSLPDSDPVTEMLLKSILQAMDEWHSLTSKVKGLAGMAENVRQGYRAGGRAPRGYRLQSIETGAIRDGAPVTKTKLVPGEDAMLVRAYLQHRARGLPRARALELVKADWPVTSLIEMERNALTYAGQTVWNRHAERTEGGYIGGEKHRPRSEWVIQPGTHEPLISVDEANAILDALETRRGKRARPAPYCYLFAGMLVSPAGEQWHGDSGYYRLGKGSRILAENVERAIVGRVMEDMQGEAMAAAVAAHYQRLGSKNKGTNGDTASLKRRIDDLTRRIGRLADLISETSAPGALLRQIEEFEAERERAKLALEGMEAEAQAMQTMRELRPEQVRRVLRGIAQDMNAQEPSALRDALREFIDRIELDPVTFDATVNWRLGHLTGVKVASPRGFEPRLPP